jgi:hypothetical protein
VAQELEVREAVMESTAQYWRPVEALEAQCIDLGKRIQSCRAAAEISGRRAPVRHVAEN